VDDVILSAKSKSDNFLPLSPKLWQLWHEKETHFSSIIAHKLILKKVLINKK